MRELAELDQAIKKMNAAPITVAGDKLYAALLGQVV
jgi:hypothetical protein